MKIIVLLGVLFAAIIALPVTGTEQTQKIYVENPVSAVSAAETEPPYNVSTHENGYCEGYCWEGSCPYFDGYPEPTYTDDELVMLAKTVWGEARGLSPEEQRLVIWTVFQRVDADDYGDTIAAVITKPNQFYYQENFPIVEEIYQLCREEAANWWHGAEPPVLAPFVTSEQYYYFEGDGSHNWFREYW